MNMQQLKETTQADFSLKVLAVSTRSKELQADIHSLAMYALWQMNEFTNSNPANELLAALPKAQRVLSLQHWFITFGLCLSATDKEGAPQIKINCKKESVKADSKRGEKLESNLAHADATPYWELINEADLRPFQFGSAEILATIKRARKAKELVGEKYSQVDLDEALFSEIEILVQAHLDAKQKVAAIAAASAVANPVTTQQEMAPAPF